MKCDVILYNHNSAIGLWYFPQKNNAPIIVFIVNARECSANNYQYDWKPELLKKLLRKAKLPAENEVIVNALSRDYKPNQEIGEEYYKSISIIYHHIQNKKDFVYDSIDKESLLKFQKSIFYLLLQPAERKLLFKQIHCTKYLKKIPRVYSLEYNESDGQLYYHRLDTDENTYIRPTEDKKTWKYNFKYKVVKKDFSGVIEKIECIHIATPLGIFNIEYDHVPVSFMEPVEGLSFSIPVAPVCYQNGRKKLVPLSCIKEYEGFDNGTGFEHILENIKKVQNCDFKNSITVNTDNSIAIENTFLYLDSNREIYESTRKLVLNVKERRAYCFLDNEEVQEDNFFKISDDEYKTVLEIMNTQIKEECGFEPDLAYGETNYDRLVNFACYPFAPELNKFNILFFHANRDKLLGQYNLQRTFESLKETEKLSHYPDGVREFIKMCDLPYTKKINKIFLKGHRYFANYLGIWHSGFRDNQAIELLMNADRKFFFAEMVFRYCYLSCCSEPQKDSDVYEIPPLIKDIKFLLEIYDEITSAKLAAELLINDLKPENSYELYIRNAFEHIKALSQEKLLSEQVIKKIGKDGFTMYNHDMLLRIYRQSHPEQKEKFKNQNIVYSAKEKELEWEIDGYKFCLPEDTDRLVDIGYKMNICVGNNYRESAVKKECIIIYAIKNNEYELCIEVQKNAEKLFKLIQKSAFSNNEPKGKVLRAFNSWCFEKGIC